MKTFLFKYKNTCFSNTYMFVSVRAFLDNIVCVRSCFFG